MLDTSKTRGSCSCEMIPATDNSWARRPPSVGHSKVLDLSGQNQSLSNFLIDFLFSFFVCHLCLLVSNRIIWWETPR